ncbi:MULTISPECIES: ParB N-terminal domain-containing protein [unclassified Ruegeria]|uniref:ParB N-terminal domain-containing protein n=1 Tax=unclassified Ruegeria TaxID=2625375 RepID=UPI00147D072F|nr:MULTISPECIES: ParB N-terminal domain-containing protein [unclassified Ruegeria]
MEIEKIDLETSMVAKELRSKLFRMNPADLHPDFQPLGELDRDDIAEIERSLIDIGVMTPVLITGDDTIVAGQGLVEAALQIGLDDIPALTLDDLSEEEYPLFFRQMYRFYRLANIDWEIFQIDAQQILSFTASGRLALKIHAMKSTA